MLHSMAAELDYIQHLCNVLQQLALLPPTSSLSTNAMATMINTLSKKLRSVLTKASEISITEVSLLDHIKGKYTPIYSWTVYIQIKNTQFQKSKLNYKMFKSYQMWLPLLQRICTNWNIYIIVNTLKDHTYCHTVHHLLS